ncbi:MAG TPA: VTT domain-containing protein [Candidatus Levybacteria bacterium]|nr:VTT domain-containing protein [Candidatus Levybacteria bacterium]
MEFILGIRHYFEIEYLIQFGQIFAYIALFGIIFAESGLLIGFFLPGDSLLFTTGFFASKGLLDIRILLPLLFVAAVAGDSVGYTFGRRVGRKLFQREKSLLFHKKHLLAAEAFYEKHGKKTIILARFVPVVRTFAPIVAGIGHMEYKTFLAYNIVGGFLWAVGVTLLGYFLGQLPIVEDNFEIAIFVIIFVSILPPIVHILQDPKHRKQLIELAKNPAKVIKREKKNISE